MATDSFIKSVAFPLLETYENLSLVERIEA